MSEQAAVCQSCAMPLVKKEDHGTEKDGSLSSVYCTYCYRNGEFVNPGATLEEIAEHGAAMISQMYEMPLDNARMFMTGQLRTLKRWSGKIVPTCQSCGMPIFSGEEAGTEKDGTESSSYCVHCYQKGEFTEPDLSHEEMIQKGIPIMTRKFGLKPEKAEEMIRTFTSALSRWS